MSWDRDPNLPGSFSRLRRERVLMEKMLWLLRVELRKCSSVMGGESPILP